MFASEETRLLEWLNSGRPSDRHLHPTEFLPGGAPKRLPGILGDFMGAFGGQPDTGPGLLGAGVEMASPLYPDPTTHGAPPGGGPGTPGLAGGPGVPGGGMGSPGATTGHGDPMERMKQVLELYGLGQQMFQSPMAQRPPTSLLY